MSSGSSRSFAKFTTGQPALSQRISVSVRSAACAAAIVATQAAAAAVTSAKRRVAMKDDFPMPSDWTGAHGRAGADQHHEAAPIREISTDVASDVYHWPFEEA